jgi:hypothetical protein
MRGVLQRWSYDIEVQTVLIQRSDPNVKACIARAARRLGFGGMVIIRTIVGNWMAKAQIADGGLSIRDPQEGLLVKRGQSNSTNGAIRCAGEWRIIRTLSLDRVSQA